MYTLVNPQSDKFINPISTPPSGTPRIFMEKWEGALNARRYKNLLRTNYQSYQLWSFLPQSKQKIKFKILDPVHKRVPNRLLRKVFFLPKRWHKGAKLQFLEGGLLCFLCSVSFCAFAHANKERNPMIVKIVLMIAHNWLDYNITDKLTVYKWSLMC